MRGRVSSRYTSPVPAAVAILEASEAYRRQARRLRCRFARQPGRLQQSLKRLAAETPSPKFFAESPVAQRTRAYPTFVQSGPARRFADYLSEQTREPMTVLQYSRRLEFLRAARRLGVGRFEANLLIAAVVERRTTGSASERAHSDADSGADSLLGRVTAFLLVEAAVLLGVWWVLFN